MYYIMYFDESIGKHFPVTHTDSISIKWFSDRYEAQELVDFWTHNFLNHKWSENEFTVMKVCNGEIDREVYQSNFMEGGSEIE